MNQFEFSIVIPIYNENDNIGKLLEEIFNNLKSFKKFEIIFVDDFSSDDSLKTLNDLKTKHNFKIVKNNKNYGQSYSIYKGIKSAKYNTIITIDGDGQNNPKDIPVLIKEYNINENIRLVGGIRFKRKDSLTKILSSKIANLVRSKLLNDNCKDTGCSLKIFDKNIFLSLPYFNGIHRFLPALFIGFGYKTHFVNVDHRSRNFGISKYGTFNRLFRGIRDMIKVLIIIKKNKNDIN